MPFETASNLYSQCDVAIPEASPKKFIEATSKIGTDWEDLMQSDIMSVPVRAPSTDGVDPTFACVLHTGGAVVFAMPDPQFTWTSITRAFVNRTTCNLLDAAELPASAKSLARNLLGDQLAMLWNNSRHPLRVPEPAHQAHSRAVASVAEDKLRLDSWANHDVYDLAASCYMAYLQSRLTLRRETEVVRWTLDTVRHVLWELAQPDYSEQDHEAANTTDPESSVAQLETEKFDCWNRFAFEFVAFGQSVFWLWMTQYITETLDGLFPDLVRTIRERYYDKWNGVSAIRGTRLCAIPPHSLEVFIKEHVVLAADPANPKQIDIMRRVLVDSYTEEQQSDIESLAPTQRWIMEFVGLRGLFADGPAHPKPIKYTGLSNRETVAFFWTVINEHVLAPIGMYLQQTCFDYGSIIQYTVPSANTDDWSSSSRMRFCRYEQLAVDTPLARVEQNLAEVYRILRGMLHTRMEDEKAGLHESINDCDALGFIALEVKKAAYQHPIQAYSKTLLMACAQLLPMTQLAQCSIPVLEEIMSLPDAPTQLSLPLVRTMVEVRVCEEFIGFAMGGGLDQDAMAWETRIAGLANKLENDPKRVPNLLEGYNSCAALAKILFQLKSAPSDKPFMGFVHELSRNRRVVLCIEKLMGSNEWPPFSYCAAVKEHLQAEARNAASARKPAPSIAFADRVKLLEAPPKSELLALPAPPASPTPVVVKMDTAPEAKATKKPAKARDPPCPDGLQHCEVLHPKKSQSPIKAPVVPAAGIAVKAPIVKSKGVPAAAAKVPEAKTAKAPAKTPEPSGKDEKKGTPSNKRKATDPVETPAPNKKDKVETKQIEIFGNDGKIQASYPVDIDFFNGAAKFDANSKRLGESDDPIDDASLEKYDITNLDFVSYRTAMAPLLTNTAVDANIRADIATASKDILAFARDARRVFTEKKALVAEKKRRAEEKAATAAWEAAEAEVKRKSDAEAARVAIELEAAEAKRLADELEAEQERQATAALAVIAAQREAAERKAKADADAATAAIEAQRVAKAAVAKAKAAEAAEAAEAKRVKEAYEREVAEAKAKSDAELRRVIELKEAAERKVVEEAAAAKKEAQRQAAAKAAEARVEAAAKSNALALAAAIAKAKADEAARAAAEGEADFGEDEVSGDGSQIPPQTAPGSNGDDDKTMAIEDGEVQATDTVLSKLAETNDLLDEAEVGLKRAAASVANGKIKKADTATAAAKANLAKAQAKQAEAVAMRDDELEVLPRSGKSRSKLEQAVAEAEKLQKAKPKLGKPDANGVRSVTMNMDAMMGISAAPPKLKMPKNIKELEKLISESPAIKSVDLLDAYHGAGSDLMTLTEQGKIEISGGFIRMLSADDQLEKAHSKDKLHDAAKKLIEKKKAAAPAPAKPAAATPTEVKAKAKAPAPVPAAKPAPTEAKAKAASPSKPAPSAPVRRIPFVKKLPDVDGATQAMREACNNLVRPADKARKNVI